MGEIERDRMRAKLDDFSRRLDAGIRDLKERGELSNAHQSVVDDIRRRRDRIRHKLESAQMTGSEGDMIEAEVERDFESIHDDLTRIIERLDSEEMKRR